MTKLENIKETENTCSHKSCDNVVDEKGDECKECYEENLSN